MHCFSWETPFHVRSQENHAAQRNTSPYFGFSYEFFSNTIFRNSEGFSFYFCWFLTHLLKPQMVYCLPNWVACLSKYGQLDIVIRMMTSPAPSDHPCVDVETQLFIIFLIQDLVKKKSYHCLRLLPNAHALKLTNLIKNFGFTQNRGNYDWQIQNSIEYL